MDTLTSLFLPEPPKPPPNTPMDKSTHYSSPDSQWLSLSQEIFAKFPGRTSTRNKPRYADATTRSQVYNNTISKAPQRTDGDPSKKYPVPPPPILSQVSSITPLLLTLLRGTTGNRPHLNIHRQSVPTSVPTPLPNPMVINILHQLQSLKHLMQLMM